MVCFPKVVAIGAKLRTLHFKRGLFQVGSPDEDAAGLAFGMSIQGNPAYLAKLLRS